LVFLQLTVSIHVCNALVVKDMNVHKSSITTVTVT
jgi:hypothetical protein